MDKKLTLMERISGVVKMESTTLRSPASWFLDALGFGESNAGVRISEGKALNLSAYFCGLNMIAGSLATLPLNVYRQNGKAKDLADMHPAHYLLHTQPNPEMSRVSFRESQVQSAIARGNAYAEIQWDGAGRPFALWPLPSHMTRPIRHEDGSLWYEIRLNSGERRYLRPENVLHTPGLGWDGIQGYGLIKVAAEAIGLNAAQEEYAAKFFKNGGNVSAVVETDSTLNDKTFERIKSEIKRNLQGLSNVHRIALLEAGLKFKPMNPTHEEAQLIDSRRFSIEEWARWFNIPPHKLKEMSHATFSNVEQQNIEFVVDSLRPWATRFEAEYDRKLFTRSSKFYTKHVLDGLLRGDQKSRFESYAIARNWGWYSANDVCELEDRNPLPGDIGDVYLIPTNMARADGKPLINDPRANPLTQAAALRLVNYEDRRLSSKKQGGDVYDQEFTFKLTEWLVTSDDVAAKYQATAKQLNLIAATESINPDELMAAKVGYLVKLVEENARVSHET